MIFNCYKQKVVIVCNICPTSHCSKEKTTVPTAMKAQHQWHAFFSFIKQTFIKKSKTSNLVIFSSFIVAQIICRSFYSKNVRFNNKTIFFQIFVNLQRPIHSSKFLCKGIKIGHKINIVFFQKVVAFFSKKIIYFVTIFVRNNRNIICTIFWNNRKIFQKTSCRS